MVIYLSCFRKLSEEIEQIRAEQLSHMTAKIDKDTLITLIKKNVKLIQQYYNYDFQVKLLFFLRN